MRYPDAGKTFTEEEKAARTARDKALRDSHPWVLISGWRCWCNSAPFNFKPIWQGIGDLLTVTCPNGHTSIIRYIPETIS